MIERTPQTRSKDTPPTDQSDNSAQQDAEIIEACLAGDENAWRTLVARYSRLVYSIPRRYGLDEADCHDVYQEVFASLVRNMGRLRDRQSLAKWLITTSHRLAWRSKDGTTLQTLDFDLRDPDTPPAEQAILWERQHMLWQALDRLGGRCRRLIHALYLDEARPNYQEISRNVGIPIGSIGPTRARCLAKLLEIAQSIGIRPGDESDESPE